ncbi:MAG TPA: cupin domain-containing protein [Dokdonella sp.]
MKASKSLQRAALCLLLLSGFAGSALADDAPAMKRTVLDRHDLSGVAGKEVVLGTAELPAGASSGWHRHPGDESGYVLKGDLVLKAKGQPDRTLKAGDFFFNPAGLVHNLMAAPGSAGGTAVSTWIVDKGVPMAAPVAE